MSDPHLSQRRRRRPRPPRVPFPSLHPAERVRGSAILDENPECGLVLWESYRNLGDWAATPREMRVPGMFGAGAAERREEQLSRAGHLDDAVRAALETVRGLLADPAGTNPRAAALACRRVSAWAGDNGRTATQFYFAAAAGLCVPDDARQAYHAGRLARDLARWDAAEVWLEYAAAAARRRRDRDTQTVAVLGLGNMFYLQGLYRKARETYLVGLSLARRHDLREHRGPALHDLFVIAVELNDHTAAESCARQALAAYGAAHPRIPALAHDVAYWWLTQADHARALPVLRAVLPHVVGRPDQRIRALANAARAAAGLGNRGLYAELTREVRRAAQAPLARAGLATALVETAVGAFLLGSRTLATELLDEALEVALERAEADVTSRVECLRRRIATSSVQVESDKPQPQWSGDDLATQLVRFLRAGGADAAQHAPASSADEQRAHPAGQ